LVADVIHLLQTYEAETGIRRRKRRPNDQATFEVTVAAVICDLTHRHFTTGGKLSVPLSKQVLGRAGRYQSPVFSETLPALLDLMVKVGLLVLDKGRAGAFGAGRRTTIEAGQRLLAMVTEHDVTVCDLMRDNTDAEVIILKSAKEDGPGGSKELLPYRDTPETLRWRAEVRRINTWLAEADIEVDEAEVGNVDVGDRDLRRIFNNGSFRQGGRLYGGFWQNLKGPARRRGIFLNGEAVAELDYGQMALRLLYGRTGVAPEGDAYLIPGLEAYRSGVKKVINALLYSDRPLRRMPVGTRQHLPPEITFGQLLYLIKERHPHIAPFLFSGIGMETMYQDSEIMVGVLLRLMNEGVVALPIHDSVVIPHSAIDLVRTTMLSVFREHTGVEGVVDVEEG